MEGLTIEEVSVKLYKAINPALYSNSPERWKDVIISAVQSLSQGTDYVNSDDVYWLLELYRMFDQIEKQGITSTDKLDTKWQ